MINNKKYITISSDASCGASRTGFAYYIRDDSGTYCKSWSVDEVMTSTKAEIVAMVSALSFAQKLKLDNDTKIIFYCDNMVAIGIVSKSIKKTLHKWGDVINMVSDILNGAEIEARHVKGHTKRKDEKKYFMNKWCDLNARSRMRNNTPHDISIRRKK